MPQIYPEPHVEVEVRSPVTIVHLGGAANGHSVGIEDLARGPDGPAPHLLMNFRGMAGVNGLELTPYMRLAMRVRQRNGRVAACHVPDGVATLFAVARLDRVVAVYENQEQALREMLRVDPLLA
jgi:hypothetical protein